MLIKGGEKSKYWSERPFDEITFNSTSLSIEDKKRSHLLFELPEISIKPNESISFLPTIPSMDVDESAEAVHRPLAPLASSETFTDVVGISNGVGIPHNDKQRLSSPEPETPTAADQPTNQTRATKSHFDSLEILFDFPSSGISTDTQLDENRISQSSNRIRFSDDERLTTTTTKNKVANRRIS